MFEKQYGDREGIEDVIVGKRRFQYEEEVKKNPLNYDGWFDYVFLEESVHSKERIRENYERAIANVRHPEEKHYWQQYIYLWINYVLYEEIEAEYMEHTRDVYGEISYHNDSPMLKRSNRHHVQLFDSCSGSDLVIWSTSFEIELIA